MKRVFIAMATLFAISTAATAQNNDTTKLSATVKICENNPQKITVIVTNPQSEKFTIDVYSRNEGYLYSQSVAKGDYKANLDFSTAADGEYTIEVSCRRGERIRKTVTMQTKELITRNASLK